MSKKLIIAEKPSVALDLSRALGKMPEVGKFTKEKDYYESDQYVISSAIGHLVELQMPGGKQKWDFDHLPIMPEKFDLQPIDDNKARLNLLKRLMKRKDVDEIINACDAGREGELIFRYLVEISEVKKPIKRMWMQSMTNQAIAEAFTNMRTDEEMLPLANAAKCRSESDWLVGINGTRAMTAFNSKYGGFSKTPVGRVKTPTLAIMVDREKEIQAFDPRDYWEVHGEFQVAAGQYPGVWFDEQFKKGDDKHARADRIWDIETANAVKMRCLGKVGEVEEKKKPSKQAPPLLYDLTSLQREGNSRFGFSARRTLQLAQSLYERHKVLTYPRTDSRYLPEDYVSVAKETMGKISNASGVALPQGCDAHAGKAVQNNWIRPNGRIFDTSKVSDHFAIIPTGQFVNKLDEAELKIYTMVMQRFIAVFYPTAEFEVTTRITRITTGADTDSFKSNGKIMVQPGWMEVYGGAIGSDKDKILVALSPEEEATTSAVNVEQKTTKPPARYSEATILSAMEGAGKLVDDEELAAAMSERGLGTPATRAQTIEGLISDKYIVRAEKELVPTTSGIRLIDELNDIGVEILCSPEMTGQWEYKLKRIEQGQLKRDGFMNEIRDLTTGVVDRTRSAAKAAKEAHYDDLDLPCPSCGLQPLKQDERSYRCKDPECKFSIWKVVASRPMDVPELEQLLTKRFVGPLTGFRSRRGEEFDAALEFDDAFKIKFITEASQERERQRQEEASQIDDAPVIAN
ncbi:MAG: DNA topoisomerase 3, partial [Verrucomicrobiota bacterium]